MALQDSPGQEPGSKNPQLEENQSQGYKDLAKSAKPIRLIIPLVIGIGFIGYMFWQKFDYESFLKIEWTGTTLFWIGMAALFMVFRHFCYMARLRIITNGEFSWRKAFELIMIWEFSSAVTPTSVGGSAVSMFVLAREGIAAGRSAMIVLYTVVIDTFFYLFMLAFYLAVFGFVFLDANDDALYTAFWAAYGFMFLYGSAFFYGVLISPKGLQKLLLFFVRLPLLNRFKKNVLKTTEDMALASAELRRQTWKFHVGAVLSTVGAWSSRFLVFNCLAIGFIVYAHDPDIHGYYTQFMEGQMQFSPFVQQVFMMARQQAMYILMAIMPTPGGSGGVEYAFLAYHSDYIVQEGSLGIIIALFWRILTYYTYLLIGYITVVRWLNAAKPKKLEANSGG